MTEHRPLDQIRSDLRSAKAFAISEDGAARFKALLKEARAASATRDEWEAVLSELGMRAH